MFLLGKFPGVPGHPRQSLQTDWRKHVIGRNAPGFYCVLFVNSESLDFLCYCAAQLAELTEYFFTKICAVMGEGGH